ncbi:unnamed protein product [Blepharisma stoltei]|uniref:CCT domain-containing protein n=1 Tax=Blepharisma stoltei TaxID=1481888 RepID=A0AAU9JQV6_9CILI|nr:unnamed protein product [Blepharisma stoltei]
MENQSCFDDLDFEAQGKEFTQHERFGSFVNLLCDPDLFLETPIPSDVLKLDPEDIPIFDPPKIIKNDKEPVEEPVKPAVIQPKSEPEKLSFEERKKKVEKYLEKRRKRPWHKKFDYNGRRRVAKQRLRIKGRFISKEQAQSLGLDKSQTF